MERRKFTEMLENEPDIKRNKTDDSAVFNQNRSNFMKEDDDIIFIDYGTEMINNPYFETETPSHYEEESLLTFQCAECDFSCTRADTLKRHRNFHSRTSKARSGPQVNKKLPQLKKNLPVFVKRKDYEPSKDVINVMSDDSSSESESSYHSDDSEESCSDGDEKDEYGIIDSATSTKYGTNFKSNTINESLILNQNELELNSTKETDDIIFIECGTEMKNESHFGGRTSKDVVAAVQSNNMLQTCNACNFSCTSSDTIEKHRSKCLLRKVNNNDDAIAEYQLNDSTLNIKHVTNYKTNTINESSTLDQNRLNSTKDTDNVIFIECDNKIINEKFFDREALDNYGKNKSELHPNTAMHHCTDCNFSCTGIDNFEKHRFSHRRANSIKESMILNQNGSNSSKEFDDIVFIECGPEMKNKQYNDSKTPRSYGKNVSERQHLKTTKFKCAQCDFSCTSTDTMENLKKQHLSICPARKQISLEKNFPIFVKRKDYDPSKDILNVMSDSSSESGSSEYTSDDDDENSSSENNVDDDEISEYGVNNTANSTNFKKNASHNIDDNESLSFIQNSSKSIKKEAVDDIVFTECDIDIKNEPCE